MKKFTDYYSATVAATGNNGGMNLKENTEYVFKSYYKLRVKGKLPFKLFFINEVETTGNFRAGKMGDGYKITGAYAAFSPDMVTEVDKTPIMFNTSYMKRVEPGEWFESDEFDFTYREEGYMVLAFKVETCGRVFIPATNESVTTGLVYENGKEIWFDNFTLRPQFIGVKTEKEKTVCFMGDSITQGTRTSLDKYEAWTHRIGNSLNKNTSFWNIGMGWSRAYDASLDKTFLAKAKMCDEVFVCFGVNDIRSGGRLAHELIADISAIKEKLEKENVKVRLLTVPPFNMSVFEEEQRKKVNEFIRGTNEYFDIASVLEKDEAGSVKDEYMVNSGDSHPNGVAGKAIFEAFLKWRDENAW